MLLLKKIFSAGNGLAISFYLSILLTFHDLELWKLRGGAYFVVYAKLKIAIISLLTIESTWNFPSSKILIAKLFYCNFYQNLTSHQVTSLWYLLLCPSKFYLFWFFDLFSFILKMLKKTNIHAKHYDDCVFIFSGNNTVMQICITLILPPHDR